MEETTISKTGAKAVVFDVKELRIGNILLWKDKPVHATSLSLDIDDEYEENIGFCYLGKNTDEMGGWVRNIWADLKPVNINPEILVKAGFNESEKGNYTKARFSVYKPVDYVGYLFCEGNLILKEIKYVHQLQNLFYALTGIELIIDLTS